MKTVVFKFAQPIGVVQDLDYSTQVKLVYKSTHLL